MHDNYDWARPLGLPPYCAGLCRGSAWDHRASGRPRGCPQQLPGAHLCLMVGTVGCRILDSLLSHDALGGRGADLRGLVLFFIVLLYASAPALAVLGQIRSHATLAAADFDTLPA